MEKGFPDKYQILPAPIERILDVATRLGRFLSPQVSVLYLSEHIKEPTDGEAYQPELPFPQSETWLKYDSEGSYFSPEDL